MRRSIPLGSLTLLTLAFGLAAAMGASGREGQAPSAAPSQDVLPALLTEVRGLRAAMEQMAAAGPRVQLALGRVQLQEQRINNGIRRLDELRAAVIAAQNSYDQLRQASRESADALRNPRADGPPVEHLKLHQAEMARELERAAAALQRATAEEGAVASDLATEQARWTELNQRMEALEASLGPR